MFENLLNRQVRVRVAEDSYMYNGGGAIAGEYSGKVVEVDGDFICLLYGKKNSQMFISKRYITTIFVADQSLD